MPRWFNAASTTLLFGQWLILEQPCFSFTFFPSHSDVRCGQSASVSETRYRLWVSFLLCSDLVKFHIVFLLEQWESKNFSVNIYVQSPWIFSSLFMKSSMAKNRSFLQFLKMIYMVWGPHHQIFMFGLYCLSLLISLQMYFCSLSLLFWMVLVTYWLWFLVYSGTWYLSIFCLQNQC